MGEKGLTFQRDFHLLVSSHYLLVNCETGEKVVTFERDSHLLVNCGMGEKGLAF